MSAQLGAPAHCHFTPDNQEHYGYHGVTHPRKKSPAQQERNRARAAAHRAKQTKETESNELSAATADFNKQNHVTPKPSAPLQSPPAATVGQPSHLPPASPVAGAGPSKQPIVVVPTAVKAAAATPYPLPRKVVKLNKVEDEIHSEKNEVKVYATATFETCPDRELSEDYFASL